MSSAADGSAVIDPEVAYRAASGRDPRFDGRFFLGVTTTGIYCRPSCPARKPLRRNAVFFPSAAAAVAAGFRACKRCRPDSLPGSRHWDASGDLAARAVRAIRDGAIDELGVAGLARRLSVSERHLHRILISEVGASPVQLNRTRRAQTARTLIEQTSLGLADIAFAAGFGSVRQFNDVMLGEYGVAPSALRRPATRAATPDDAPASDAAPTIVLRLRHRAPYDDGAMRAFQRAHAIPGMDLIGADGAFTTPVPATHGPALATVDWAASGDEHLTVRIRPADIADLTGIVAKLRRWLDLDADPQLIADALGHDPVIGPLIAARPGLRTPGSLDGPTTAMLTVVGQAVSLKAAGVFASRLVGTFGAPVGESGLRAFPTAQTVADAGAEALREIGLTGSRAAALHRLAGALAGGLELSPAADRAEARRELLALPGIGPWTADYIALRALGDPDSFAPDDLVLKKSLGAKTARQASVIAAAWSPWRSYAAMHLWTASAYLP
ncbi:Ada metal-binding domain-containing protein [Gryllotalpicola protaetiae]|uniref:DNA-3-methyladenine glycosylase II n=1 Tax=Gryllotalpicola protaetiae TaxID=2419771 RepID=A0A387BM84_9MICO|nr:Ada metal-binding domain-containing protein [Gryllotalpicola protaetiae]AYG03502.1 DNA-3-methyladenine glycosylase 2 family protein [Gryllotalpicola protaetiae]